MKVAAYALFAALVAVAVPVSGAQEPASGLQVAEYGVGTSVEARELKGKATSFAEGASVVFWTNIVGGQAGDRIQHVWIHDGKETSIGLSIGGNRWRTYSKKRLHPGLVGDAGRARCGQPGFHHGVQSNFDLRDHMHLLAIECGLMRVYFLADR